MALLPAVFLLLLTTHSVSHSSILNIPHHLFTSKIADLLPTNDLLSLFQSDRMMSHILGPLVMMRHSMYLCNLSTDSFHYLRSNRNHSTTVSLAENFLETDLMADKYQITDLELKHSRSLSNHSYHTTEGQSVSPPTELLLKHVSRFQESHTDYHSIDVNYIKWLTDSLSTEQLLSLGSDACPAAISFSCTILRYLRTLGKILKFGKAKYANNELKGISLFTKMEWMEQFKYPHGVSHFWFQISGMLFDAQSSIATEEYSKHKQWYDEWFTLVHSSWQYILKEVRNHLFFRQFRSIEDIPRFQHSVHWTIFFYRFQTEGYSGSRHVVELKQNILMNHQFRNGIRSFINEVETALNEVKPIRFASMKIPEGGILYDDVFYREIDGILQHLRPTNNYERWVINILLRSLDVWTPTLGAIANGAPVQSPKELVAAKMLWGVEAVMSYIEPIVFGVRKNHQILLSFRQRMRFYIHQLILGEAWISGV